MKKKFIISIFVILFLIIVAGGGFFWWQNREIKGSPEDYIIKETPEGKIVENKKAGLIVKIPEGWIEKKMEIMEGSIVLYTPEVEERWLNEMSPLKKGCGIEIAVVYKKMNFDEIKKEIKQIHAGLGIKSEEFEEITINNRQALKNTFDSIVIGPGIVVYFPSKDKLYSVSINWGPDEKENCLQEFNKFLETILIK